MTPEQFVSYLFSSIVDENVELYKELFVTCVDDDTVSDPYWVRALGLFRSLTLEQREVFFAVIRQVVVDTTSNALGVVDGTSFLAGADGGVELMAGGQKLSGDLQSLFLAEDERHTG